MTGTEVPENVLETPAAPAVAESMQDYKRRETARLSGAATTEPVVPIETAGAATLEPGDKPSATAGDSETPGTPNQEKPDNRSKEARFADLSNKRKAAEAERDRERERADTAVRELEALRNGTRKPQDEPAPKPKAATAETDPNDPEPSEADFDTVYAHMRALARWEARQERKAEKKAEAKEAEDKQAKEAEETVRKTVTERLSKASEKYPDWAERAAETAHLKPNPGIGAALNQSEHTVDLRYHLMTHPEDFERINAMAPQDAYYQMGRLEAILTAKPAGIPDKPKAPVSKAPPPAPQVSGTAPSGPELDTSKARSMSEYKRIEALKAQRKAG